MIAQGPDGDVAVVDPGGKPLGVVNLRRLAGAMVNSDGAAQQGNVSLAEAL